MINSQPAHNAPGPAGQQALNSNKDIRTVPAIATSDGLDQMLEGPGRGNCRALGIGFHSRADLCAVDEYFCTPYCESPPAAGQRDAHQTENAPPRSAV